MNQSRSADVRPPTEIIPEMKQYNVDFQRYHQVCQQVRNLSNDNVIILRNNTLRNNTLRNNFRLISLVREVHHQKCHDQIQQDLQQLEIQSSIQQWFQVSCYVIVHLLLRNRSSLRGQKWPAKSEITWYQNIYFWRDIHSLCRCRFYKFKNSKFLPRHEISILILKLGLLKPRSTASMTTWQSLMTFRYSSLLFKRLFRINFDFSIVDYT